MSIFVLVPLLYLAAVSVPLAVTDARTHRLPNALVVPGLVLLAWGLVGVGTRDPPSALGSLTAAGGAAAVLGAGWALGGVGMGDVKLGVWLAGLAALTGVFDRPALLAALTGAFDRPDILAGTAGASQGPGGLVYGLAAATVLAAASFAGHPHGRIPLGPSLLGAFWFAVLPVLPAAL
jgi:leader peptidase (prepilin peptidase)/N-methyltransferase